ncbi:MAG: N,N-dimethylformamidase beta subunit family domain-containing protein, partial [Candidatus Acidiferrales bacterium]
MADVVAWALVIAIALGGIAGAEWVQLFARRRWHVRVKLPDPVAYTDAPSFFADSEIAIRIHSSKPVRVRWSRCGQEKFELVKELNASASPQSRSMDRWHGFDWAPSAVLLANSLEPGYYRVDIEHQDDASRQWCMAVIVRDRASQPVLVVASTNTWNAYNDFGGLSNYKDHSTPQPLKLIRSLAIHLNLKIRIAERHWLLAVPLPERRPNAPVHRDLRDPSGAPSHLAREEAALIRFLEREAVAYSVISDRDFALDPNASQTRLIIFNTHSEYWSEEMIGRVEEFIQRGTSVAFLSGNNMYRKVQFLDKAIVVTDQLTPPEQVVPLIGSYYDPLGYRTFAAYRIADAGHWCWEGLSVQNGSEFGEGNARRP